MGKVLSISVAAYNVEKFINQCLDSFVASRLIDDVEVIVTDDGSKDNTADIVSTYCDKYPTSIILVKQENAGPGSTVNSGISVASGKYFRMVDGDDWVNTEDFTKLIEQLKNIDSDAVINNYVMVDNDTAEQVRCPVNNFESGVENKFADIADKLDIAMHNFIVKTEIMKRHVKLLNGFYTDTQYLLFPTRYIKTLTYLDLDVYMYRVSLATQSMSITSLQRNIAQHDAVVDSLLSFYEDYIASDDLDKRVEEYLRAKIVSIAGCELSTLLSFKANKERREDLYAFFDKISSMSPNVYNTFKKLKTVRVLLLSQLFYRPVSFLHRKRVKA